MSGALNPAPLPPGRPLSVAVVNDYELITRGVAAMLQPFNEIVEVVELDLEIRLVRQVDIALYDAFGATNLGSDALDELCRNTRIGRVVLYTWTLTQELIDSAFRCGVHSALHKSLAPDELVQALISAPAHTVEPGSPSRTTTIARDSWPGCDCGLTRRESEVISLVTAGLSNNEIAKITYLSINSVKSYIRSAYRTMGATNRSQAILWGIDHGMAPTRKRVVAAPR